MSGKGSKPRPFSVNQETFASNWDKIFNKDKQDLAFESDNPLERPYDPYYAEGDKLWQHECPMEKSSMMVEKGKACNWCGQFENGSLD